MVIMLSLIFLNRGLVDDSYIVSLMVCDNCGNYAIEIEQCEI